MLDSGFFKRINPFNMKSGWRFGVQAYNLVALCLATQDLINNPDATWSTEGADAFIHLFTLFSLQEQANVWLNISSATLNLMRIGAIWEIATAGYLDTPMPIFVLDALSHAINTITSLKTEVESSAPPPSPHMN